MTVTQRLQNCFAADENLSVKLLVSFFAATFLAIPLSYLPTSAATAVVQVGAGGTDGTDVTDVTRASQ